MILQEAAIQGPVVSEEAPVNLGPVLSGVFPGTQGGPSALSSDPDHAWQSEAGHLLQAMRTPSPSAGMSPACREGRAQELCSAPS